MTEHTSSDCRTIDGVTIALIDGIIATCRVLRQRDLRLSVTAVASALADLRADEDVRALLNPDGQNSWQCPAIQPEHARLGRAQRCSLGAGHESPHAWVGKHGSLSTWEITP